MDGWTAHRRTIGLTGMFIYDTFTGPVISVGWIKLSLEMTDGLMSRVWMDRWTDWRDGRPDRLNGCIVWMDGQMDGRWYQQTDWTHSYITWWTDRQMDRDRSNRQTDGQIDRYKYTGRQHGWMNWMNGLTGQMEGQMKWIDRWMDGLNGWTNELNSWTDGQTNRRTQRMEWLNGRMDDRLNAWINGRIRIIE